MNHVDNPYIAMNKMLTRHWFMYVTAFQKTVDEFKKWISPPVGSKQDFTILDIGQGVGVFLHNAKNRFSKNPYVNVVGVDKYAYSGYSNRNSNVKTYTSNIVDLNIPQVDRILCCYSVGCYAETQIELNTQIKKIGELLKPGGKGMMVCRSLKYDPSEILVSYFYKEEDVWYEKFITANLNESFEGSGLIITNRGNGKVHTKGELVVEFEKPIIEES